LCIQIWLAGVGLVVVALTVMVMAVVMAIAVVVISVAIMAALVTAAFVLRLPAAGRGGRTVLTVGCAAATGTASRDAPGSRQNAGRSANQQAGYDQDAYQA
jgi:hypothetical protein